MTWSVCSGWCTNLIDKVTLESEKDSAGSVLAPTGLGEERVESIITTTNGLFRGHLTIPCSMLKSSQQATPT